MNNEVIIDGVTKYLYAYLDEKDIMQFFTVETKPLTHPQHIPYFEEDQTLIGKWYDRENSTIDAPIFIEVPFWITADTTTDKIGIKRSPNSLAQHLGKVLPTATEPITVTIPVSSKEYVYDASEIMADGATYVVNVISSTYEGMELPGVKTAVYSGAKKVVIARDGTAATKIHEVTFKIVRVMA